MTHDQCIRNIYTVHVGLDHLQLLFSEGIMQVLKMLEMKYCMKNCLILQIPISPVRSSVTFNETAAVKSNLNYYLLKCGIISCFKYKGAIFIVADVFVVALFFTQFALFFTLSSLVTSIHLYPE